MYRGTKNEKQDKTKHVSEMLQTQRQWVNIFKVLKGKEKRTERKRETGNLEFYAQRKYLSEMKGKLRSVLNKQS